MTRGQSFTYILVSFILIAGSAILIVYAFALFLKLIPLKYVAYVDAGIIASIGVFVVLFVNRMLRLELSRSRIPGVRKSNILLMIDLIIYFVLSVAVLSSLRVNVASIILGAAFLSIVLALAVQGVLGNIASGLLIMLARPFGIGDRIYILPWNSSSPLITLQFSVFIPKYFSMDAMYSQGILGSVDYITLNYTKLKDDDGNIMTMPNSIVSTGAFLFPDSNGKMIIRYEIPKSINPDVVYSRTEKSLASFESKVMSRKMFVDETTLNTYVMLLFIILTDSGTKSTRTEIISSLKKDLERFRINISAIRE